MLLFFPMICVVAMKKDFNRKLSLLSIKAMRFFAILLIVFISGGIVSCASADMDVFFLDVGQADAALVCCDGQYLLIDGGDPGDSRYIYSFLSDHVLGGVLDHIIATHPHNDHIGGLPAAFSSCRVKQLHMLDIPSDSKAYDSLLRYANEQGSDMLYMRSGDAFSLGSAEVLILSAGVQEDVNDASAVVRVTYGNCSFLFMADVSFRTEYDLIANGLVQHSDVLKVGHHGSAMSSSAAFLDFVSPSYSVISVGKDNAFGHPASETLERLLSLGSAVFRTDLSGMIKVSTDGSSITVTPERIVDMPMITADPPAIPEGDYLYIGNGRSLRFHFPECESVRKMSPKNMVLFDSRAEAILAGFVSCGACQP